MYLAVRGRLPLVKSGFIKIAFHLTEPMRADGGTDHKATRKKRTTAAKRTVFDNLVATLMTQLPNYSRSVILNSQKTYVVTVNSA